MIKNLVSSKIADVSQNLKIKKAFLTISNLKMRILLGNLK